MLKKVLMGVTALYCVGVGLYALSVTWPLEPKETSDGKTATTLTPTPKPPEGLKVGEVAPDFKLNDLAGNAETLSAYKGKKPVLIEIFASWCPHCQHSVGFMKRMNQKYGTRVRVFAINGGDKPGEPTTAYDFRQQFFVDYTILDAAPESLKKAYKVGGIPAIYLVDKHGKVAWALDGSPTDVDEAALEKVIQRQI